MVYGLPATKPLVKSDCFYGRHGLTEFLNAFVRERNVDPTEQNVSAGGGFVGDVLELRHFDAVHRIGLGDDRHLLSIREGAEESPVADFRQDHVRSRNRRVRFEDVSKFGNRRVRRKAHADFHLPRLLRRVQHLERRKITALFIVRPSFFFSTSLGGVGCRGEFTSVY